MSKQRNWEKPRIENLIRKFGSESVYIKNSPEEVLREICKSCKKIIKIRGKRYGRQNLEFCKCPKKTQPKKVELRGLFIWAKDDNSIFILDTKKFVEEIDKAVGEIGYLFKSEFNIAKIDQIKGVESIFPQKQKTDIQRRIGVCNKIIKDELGVTNSNFNFSNNLLLKIIIKIAKCHHKVLQNWKPAKITKKKEMSVNKTEKTHFLLALKQLPEQAIGREVKINEFVGTIKKVLDNGNRISIVNDSGESRNYIVSVLKTSEFAKLPKLRSPESVRKL